MEVRAVGWQEDPTDQSDRSDPVAHWKLYARWLEHDDPAAVANALLCLIHQANYLLDQQISALERDFVQEGGYSEQLAAARIAERQKQHQRPAAALPAAPDCPRCGKPMALRTAWKGARAGSQFWGCPDFPACKAIRQLEGSDRSNPSPRTGILHAPKLNWPSATVG
jgi:four helix bundle suffix protein